MTFNGMPSVAQAEAIYALSDEGLHPWTIAYRLGVTIELVERVLRRRPKA